MHDTYTLMRQFADSWALLTLVGFFVGAFLWVWRPGSRPLHDDAARSIFREGVEPPRALAGACDRQCATCACSKKGAADDR
ncbi:cbb3-type cytochrome c oxidase subunit 3 [Paracoccus sp. TK19116]|uniref:Cbb3-type cytochrome c oxidase subunit 3 n=1 Tax=Paracoccus albicereus TaxID=2922394 RepID=A0ABT1MUS9_9RHOB|nr:cbb3-type cytochrome c oxidase subunit 3 [Paracoccus albicereus]MCQ0972104.1 cbb3-type cytochrome c oxidase subunit 3 [Paracoccus albicereus]